MAAGGGEGGFGVRVVDGGRFGFAHLVDVAGAERASTSGRDCQKITVHQGLCASIGATGRTRRRAF